MNTPNPNQPIKLKNISAQISRLRRWIEQTLQEEKYGDKVRFDSIDLGMMSITNLTFRRSSLISFIHPKWEVDFFKVQAHCDACSDTISRETKIDVKSLDDLCEFIQKAVNVAYGLDHSNLLKVVTTNPEEGTLVASPRIRVSEQENSSGGAATSSPPAAKAQGLVLSDQTSKPLLRVKDVPSKVDRTSQSGQELIQQPRSTNFNPGGVFLDPIKVNYKLESGASVKVNIPWGVCEKLVLHCDNSNIHHREVGGVIVGVVEKKREERADYVCYEVTATDLIEFNAADSSGSHLHLDYNSWVYVQQEFETKYKKYGKNILGWYHTHPTQGIFFSSHDDDFHTTFRLPYQFALVVDPQSMTAGLLYWKRPNKRELSHPPHCFPLLPHAEPAEYPSAESPNQENRSPSSDREESADLVKVISAGVLGVSMVGYLIFQGLERTSKSLSFDSDNACLIAMVVLAGLRLWNARWFHSRQTIFSAAANWYNVRNKTTEKKDRRVNNRRPSRYFYVTVLSVSLGLVIVLAAALLMRYGDFWREEAPPRNGANTTPPIQASAPNAAPTSAKTSQKLKVVEIEVKAEPDVRTPKSITLSSASAGQVIYEYKKKQGKGGKNDAPLTLSSNDDREEKRFLDQLLGWNLDQNKFDPYIKNFQTHAGLDKPNGLWGPYTRREFIKRVLEAARNNRAFRLPAPDGDIQVTCKLKNE